MPTAMWSYRIAPRHRAIMRKVASALKRDPQVARALGAAVDGRPAPGAAVGAFKDEEAALGFIRDRLVVSLQPEAIWLFGSRARGEAGPDSEWDLLVIVPGCPEPVEPGRR